MKSKQKFTLLELLIVVAIIAILAGILLPALTSALNKAKAVTCLSGMKQLGLAVQNYLDSNNDTIFVMTADYTRIFYDGKETYADLSHIARDAAGINSIVCKSGSDTGPTPYVPKKYVCSLNARAQQLGRPNESALKPCESINSNCSGHLRYYRFYGMLMGSAKWCLSSSGIYYHQMQRLRQPSVSLFWSEGVMQLKKDAQGGLGVIDDKNKEYGIRQHSDRTNVLYFDGHAGSVGLYQTVCSHNDTNTATLKECASCRFWFPYKK